MTQKLDFSGQDLRGKSFAGQDLKEANFSGADIRGTTFKGANLEDADFSGVTAGKIDSFIIYNKSNIFPKISSLDLIAFSVFLIITLIPLFFTIIIRMMLHVFFGNFDSNISLVIFAAIFISISLTTIYPFIVPKASVKLFKILYKLKFFREHTSNIYKQDSINAIECIKYFPLSGLNNTNFQKANLKSVNFTNAKLEKTYFNKAILIGTIWKNVEGLNFPQYSCSYLEHSILIQPKVTKLLISGDGRKKDYSENDLSDMNLRGFDLRDANLTKIHALGTDFSGANLTGACIKNWNINSKTKFDDVICDYVYLESNQQKRYPPYPETFESGDFAKLFQTVGETIELFFREGIDWQAFLSSFNEFKQHYNDASFSVQSFEQKLNDAFLVKLTVPENATEQQQAEYRQAFYDTYESKLQLIEQTYQTQLLQAKTECDGYRRSYNDLKTSHANLEEMAKTLAQAQKVEINQEIKNMAGNDYSGMTTHVHDNAIVTFGDVSGTVAQTINQLSQENDADKKTLQELLTKLQKLIEKAEELEQPTKIDALQHVNTLAKAATNPNMIGKQAAFAYFEELAQAVLTSALAGEINKLLANIATYLPK